jgi:hypothetical protein
MIVEFKCPHCNGSHDDPFELFGPWQIESMTCEGCKCGFSFAIVECESCANEQILTWRIKPDAAAFDDVTCDGCGARLRVSDDQSQTETSDRIE